MKDNKLIERNYYKEFLKKTLKSPSFIIPFSVLTLMFAAGFIFSNFVNLDSYLNINLEKQFILPSLQYPFGTNAFGQNLFPLILIGAYKTILLSLIATFINTLIGMIIGVLWGLSSKVDSVMFVVKNLIDNIPLIFLYIIIISLLGDGFIPLLIVVILFGWIDTAAIIRNNIMLLKTKDYNKISKLYNVSAFKIAKNNYIPSILPILANRIALCIPQIISIEITISYFGFSLGNDNSLGVILYNSISNNNYFSYPHLFIFPFLLLSTINLCIVLIGKALSKNFTKEEF